MVQFRNYWRHPFLNFNLIFTHLTLTYFNHNFAMTKLANSSLLINFPLLKIHGINLFRTTLTEIFSVAENWKLIWNVIWIFLHLSQIDLLPKKAPYRNFLINSRKHILHQKSSTLDQLVWRQPSQLFLSFDFVFQSSLICGQSS